MDTTAKTATGALIRRKRLEAGLNIPSLARLVGSHKANVIKIEQGRQFPTRTLDAYVEALHITRSELIAATGLSSYELAALGVPLFEDTCDPQPDTFYRHQIHPRWYQPIDLRLFSQSA